MSDVSLEQKAVEILENVERLAEPAMQITLSAVRVGAIIDVVTCVVALAIIFFLWRHIATVLYPKWHQSESDALEVGGAISAIIVGTISLVGTVAAFCVLLSSNTWLAIVSPEMALARMLISKIS